MCEQIGQLSVIVPSVCLPSDALSQRLPSYLGFSYLGRGVAPLSHCPLTWAWGSSSRLLLCCCSHCSCIVWTPPDGQHQNQIDYNLYSQRWRSSVQSAKTRMGTDCGSDHELLTVKFIEESGGNHETIQVCPKSNPLWLYSGSEK